ncbi:MAG: hypothetical protein ACXVXE_16195, partial [Nocardioidaceae bacterium]
MVIDDDTSIRPYRPINRDDRPTKPMNQLGEAARQTVLKVAVEYPDWGPKRLHYKLSETGQTVSVGEVRSVLRHL